MVLYHLLFNYHVPLYITDTGKHIFYSPYSNMTVCTDIFVLWDFPSVYHHLHPCLTLSFKSLTHIKLKLGFYILKIFNLIFLYNLFTTMSNFVLCLLVYVNVFDFRRLNVFQKDKVEMSYLLNILYKIIL